ncbi:MAG: DUF1330 domain-containing protein [Sandaracinobacter sp.]
MTTWLIITAKIHDRAKFLEAYGKPAAALLARHGGEYVLRAPGAELLEGGGPAGESVVISRWPSRDAALAFWNGPDYAALKAARAGIADCRILLVDDNPAGPG